MDTNTQHDDTMHWTTAFVLITITARLVGVPHVHLWILFIPVIVQFIYGVITCREDDTHDQQ